MSVVRLISFTIDPVRGGHAEAAWTEKCMPLMIEEAGCEYENMMRSLDDPGQFQVYTIWESDQALEKYLNGPTIKKVEDILRQVGGKRTDAVHYDLEYAVS